MSKKKKNDLKKENAFEQLSNQVLNKKAKKTYKSPLDQKKDNSVLWVGIFVIVFCLMIFGGNDLIQNNQKKEYNIPASTKVLSDSELTSLAEEIEESENEEFAQSQSQTQTSSETTVLTKEYFDTLAGTHSSSEMIVEVAKSQIGEKGGEPYWSYWGFTSRVGWCQIFVSWCAEQCGYIDAGIVPYFGSVNAGIAWFKENGLWEENDIIPTPGMYIYFDTDDPGGYGPIDGKPDHVGLVERYEDGVVYCVEGNYNDQVAQTNYPVGYYQILGYGTPNYS